MRVYGINRVSSNAVDQVQDNIKQYRDDEWARKKKQVILSAKTDVRCTTLPLIRGRFHQTALCYAEALSAASTKGNLKCTHTVRHTQRYRKTSDLSLRSKRAHYVYDINLRQALRQS